MVVAAAVVATVAIAAVVEVAAVGVTERKLGGSQLTIRNQVDLEVLAAPMLFPWATVGGKLTAVIAHLHFSK
jgi:predicted thioesterase